MKILLPILLSALLVGVDEKKTYLLQSGKTVEAQILEVRDSRVKMRVHMDGGSLERWYRLEEFRSHSAYRILRSVAAPNVAGAHLSLAEFAASKNLIAPARRELELARRLSGDKTMGASLEQEIYRRGAEGLERLLRAALEQGRLDAAENYLSAIMIRYPRAKSVAEREALVTLLESKKSAVKAKRLRARAERESARVTKRRETLLRTPRKLLASGLAANRKGLLDSRHFARAHGYFTKAVRYYKSAIKSARSLGKKQQKDDVLKREAEAIQTEAEAAMKDSLLNSGSLCLVRGKFSAVFEHVNRVLALDSRNTRALAMRARAEIAANQGGYGY